MLYHEARLLTVCMRSYCNLSYHQTEVSASALTLSGVGSVTGELSVSFWQENYRSASVETKLMCPTSCHLLTQENCSVGSH